MQLHKQHTSKCPARSYVAIQDLLGAMETWVAQALAGDDMTNAVETVAAVVLAIFAVSAIRAAQLAPVTHKTECPDDSHCH